MPRASCAGSEEGKNAPLRGSVLPAQKVIRPTENNGKVVGIGEFPSDWSHICTQETRVMRECIQFVCEGCFGRSSVFSCLSCPKKRSPHPGPGRAVRKAAFSTSSALIRRLDGSTMFHLESKPLTSSLPQSFPLLPSPREDVLQSRSMSAVSALPFCPFSFPFLRLNTKRLPGGEPF